MQHDEHIVVQTRPVLRELHFFLQAALQPRLIISSTMYVTAAWTVAKATTSHQFNCTCQHHRTKFYFGFWCLNKVIIIIIIIISDLPAILLSAKAGDIVEASPELAASWSDLVVPYCLVR